MQTTIHSVSFFPTAKCNLSCPMCIARGWMDKNPNYEATLENVIEFIDATKRQDTVYDFISFSGGEPTLWPHLADAAEMFRTSGITNKLILFTNGLKTELFTKDFVDLFDKIRVSPHGELNAKEIEFLVGLGYKHLAEFDWDNWLGGESRHCILPTEPEPDVLPPVCGCNRMGLIGEFIWVCVLVLPAINRLNLLVEEWLKYRCRVKDANFIDRFKDSDIFTSDFCKMCLANKKVRKIYEEKTYGTQLRNTRSKQRNRAL